MSLNDFLDSVYDNRDIDNFFDQVGIYGLIDKIYLYNLETIRDKGYNIQIVDKTLIYKDNNKIKFPSMTTRGTFIVDNQERFFMSQEILDDREFFISKSSITDNPKKVPYTFLQIKLGNNYHPLIIIFENGKLAINISSIYKDINYLIDDTLQKVLNIPLGTFLKSISKSSLKNNILKFLSNNYNQQQAAKFICTLFDICVDEHVLNNKQINMVKDKIFANMSDENIIYTCILCCYKLIYPTFSDRDHVGMKIIRTSSSMIFSAIVSDIKHFLSRKEKRNKKTTKFGKSLENLLEGIKTGTVTVKGKKWEKIGSVISQRNTIDHTECIRKTTILTNENSNNMIPRYVHRSQKGFLCPAQTSDGKNSGLSSYLAVSCVISRNTDIELVLDFIVEYQDNYGKYFEDSNQEKILEYSSGNLVENVNNIGTIINGMFCGHFKINYLALKREFPFISIYYKDCFIYIRTYGGRLMRPLLIKNTKIACFVDAMEIEYNSDFYIEIYKSYTLSIAASMIPFSEHNQSARLSFGCNMIKQAICNNFDFNIYEYSSIQRTLLHGEDPICQTDVSKYFTKNMKMGKNCIVAVMTFNGLNQEDSIIISESLISNGFFRNKYYKQICLVDTKFFIVDNKIYIIGNTDIIEKIIIISPHTTKYEFVTIKDYVYMVQERNLQIGDKISSRQGQKSIIAAILQQKDMPRLEDGTYVDIIMNPQAFPSRMTLGQLIESSIGNYYRQNGTYPKSFGEQFEEKNYEELKDYMEYPLINPNSNDFYRDMEGNIKHITVGPVFYMALAQQVNDKLFGRYEGPLSPFSRQPTTGKAKEGGLRIGEMEIDALIGHDAIEILKYVINQSDGVYTKFCKTCRKRIEKRCPKDHQTIILNVPMSKNITEDLLKCLCIDTYINID